MKGMFGKIISVGIILFIISINLRTFTGFLSSKGEKSNGEMSYTNDVSDVSQVSEIIPEKPLEKLELATCPEAKEKINATGAQIIIRLDDIHFRSNTKILTRFIEDAKKFNAPLVLGITPEHLEKNTELYAYLMKESCNFEIAIHGWDHFSATTSVNNKQFITEFSGISMDDMILRINQARSVLSKLTSNPIITLTPPYNIISASGVLAAEKSGIYVISSIGSGAFDAPRMSNILESKEILPKESIIDTCKSSLKNYNICVILFHPFHFTKEGGSELDENAYQEYLGLLKHFSENGSNFTTFWALRKTWPEFFQYSLIK